MESLTIEIKESAKDFAVGATTCYIELLTSSNPDRWLGRRQQELALELVPAQLREPLILTSLKNLTLVKKHHKFVWTSGTSFVQAFPSLETLKIEIREAREGIRISRTKLSDVMQICSQFDHLKSLEVAILLENANEFVDAFEILPNFKGN